MSALNLAMRLACNGELRSKRGLPKNNHIKSDEPHDLA